MTDLETYKIFAEKLYHQDQNLRRDIKIIIGLTKEIGGQLIVTFTGTKKKALKHASNFVKKYKKVCFIYDFIDYETRGVVKFTKVDRTSPNLN